MINYVFSLLFNIINICSTLLSNKILFYAVNYNRIWRTIWRITTTSIYHIYIYIINYDRLTLHNWMKWMVFQIQWFEFVRFYFLIPKKIRFEGESRGKIDFKFKFVFRFRTVPPDQSVCWQCTKLLSSVHWTKKKNTRTIKTSHLVCRFPMYIRYFLLGHKHFIKPVKKTTNIRLNSSNTANCSNTVQLFWYVVLFTRVRTLVEHIPLYLMMAGGGRGQANCENLSI